MYHFVHVAQVLHIIGRHSLCKQKAPTVSSGPFVPVIYLIEIYSMITVIGCAVPSSLVNCTK
jgi:hypothetical protein